MPGTVNINNELKQLQALHLAAAQKATYILSLTEEGVSTSSNFQENSKQKAAAGAVNRRNNFITKKVMS